MLSRAVAGILSAVFVLSTGVSAVARDGKPVPAGLPDPATGQIDGKLAMVVAPVKPGGGGPLSPWGFKAHLTGYDDPAVDLVFPCGIWFQPPAGRYRLWVEGDWQISPFTHVVSYSPVRFKGRGMISGGAVGPAGRVALPPDVARSPGLVFRLLHAGSHLDGGFPRWELSRRTPVQDVGEGLLMPVGPAIGALWDERSQRYTALSRPFDVKARETVAAPLESPAGTAHLVAQIQRARPPKDQAGSGMEIALRRDGKDLPPDLRVLLADRAYAVWYGLAPGPAELRAATGDAELESPQQLSLSAGKIERLYVKLKTRPDWTGASR